MALAGLVLTVVLAWLVEAEGLPPLPNMGIVLLRHAASVGEAAAEALAATMIDGFAVPPDHLAGRRLWCNFS